MATLVSAAHDGAPACVKVVVREPDETEGDRTVYTFHATGEIERTVAIEGDDDAPRH